jgi:hypothetical protein
MRTGTNEFLNVVVCSFGPLIVAFSIEVNVHVKSLCIFYVTAQYAWNIIFVHLRY